MPNDHSFSIAKLKDTYLNLTPHTIVMESPDGTRTEFPPHGAVLRVQTETKVEANTTDGFPIRRERPPYRSLNLALDMIQEHISCPGHPELGRNRIIISGRALDWLSPMLEDNERHHVLAPDTSTDSAVRDKDGRIVAVRAFRIGTK